MAISGMSFVLELDKQVKDLKQIRPVSIHFVDNEGKTKDMDFGIFSSRDYDIDIDKKNFVVEVDDAFDYDGSQITDIPSVNDFKTGEIKYFLFKTGEDEDSVLHPVKIKNLTFYQNGHRFDVPELEQKFTDALAYVQGDEKMVLRDVYNEKLWVPYSSLLEKEREKYIHELIKAGDWHIDACRNTSARYSGNFYFGNYMFSLTPEGSIEEWHPPYTVCSGITEDKIYNFSEDDVDSLVNNNLPMEPEVTFHDAIKNDVKELSKKDLAYKIVVKLLDEGILNVNDLKLYNSMKDKKTGFFQQFNKRYKELEELAYLKLDFPEELIKKSRLNYSDVCEIGNYYYYLGQNLTRHERNLIDKNRIIVKEMIKDGLSESRIPTVFLDINKRMNIGIRNNGVVKILQEPEIKALLETRKIIRERTYNFER